MKTAFIGHRFVLKDNLKNLLFEKVKEQIEQGCKIFTVGTHGEFDKLSLSVCRELRRYYKDIIIEVVITSLNQIMPTIYHDPIYGEEKYLPYEDVNTVMYDIEEEHYKRKILSSNKQMIDTCDTLICYVDENRYKSGAKDVLKYARKRNLQIINLYYDK